jgi:hypothetical protein
MCKRGRWKSRGYRASIFGQYEKECMQIEVTEMDPIIYVYYWKREGSIVKGLPEGPPR